MSSCREDRSRRPLPSYRRQNCVVSQWIMCRLLPVQRPKIRQKPQQWWPKLEHFPISTHSKRQRGRCCPVSTRVGLSRRRWTWTRPAARCAARPAPTTPAEEIPGYDVRRPLAARRTSGTVTREAGERTEPGDVVDLGPESRHRSILVCPNVL